MLFSWCGCKPMMGFCLGMFLVLAFCVFQLYYSCRAPQVRMHTMARIHPWRFNAHCSPHVSAQKTVSARYDWRPAAADGHAAFCGTRHADAAYVSERQGHDDRVVECSVLPPPRHRRLFDKFVSSRSLAVCARPRLRAKTSHVVLAIESALCPLASPSCMEMRWVQLPLCCAAGDASAPAASIKRGRVAVVSSAFALPLSHPRLHFLLPCFSLVFAARCAGAGHCCRYSPDLVLQHRNPTLCVLRACLCGCAACVVMAARINVDSNIGGGAWSQSVLTSCWLMAGLVWVALCKYAEALTLSSVCCLPMSAGTRVYLQTRI